MCKTTNLTNLSQLLPLNCITGFVGWSESGSQVISWGAEKEFHLMILIIQVLSLQDQRNTILLGLDYIDLYATSIFVVVVV